MALKPLLRASHPVRVVLSTPAVMSFVSVWKAVALAMAQLGVAAFFLAGVTSSTLGPTAAWWVLAACVLSAFVRAIDMESWALLIPGGTIGRLEQAFGPRAGRIGAAATLIERLLLATLASVVVGHYVTGALVPAISGRLRGSVTAEDIATLLAVILIGLLWTRARVGLTWRRDTIATGIWIAVGILSSLRSGRSSASGTTQLLVAFFSRHRLWSAGLRGRRSTRCSSSSSDSAWPSPLLAVVTPCRAPRTNSRRRDCRPYDEPAWASCCSRSRLRPSPLSLTSCSCLGTSRTHG